MQKRRGRPPAAWPSEQIAVRLPKVMIDQLRKKARGRERKLSVEIRERLAASLFDDETEQNFRNLTGQIKSLATDVELMVGANWHADKQAHQVFLEILRRLLADIPQPTAQGSPVKAKPDVLADLIYTRHVALTRDYEKRQEKENG